MRHQKPWRPHPTLGKMAPRVMGPGIKRPGRRGFRMFDELMRFFQSAKPRRRPEPPPHVPNPRLSVAVLMVEAALQDEHFCDRERGMIESLLTRRFALSSQEYARLIAAAEEQNKQMVQLHGYT